MACERYKSRLIEEALVPGGDSELAVHLSGCAECRDEVARQRELQNRINGSIAAMVAVQPSPVLLARVRQQIDAEESPRRAAWMQWTIGGIATAALAGFAIWFAGRALLRQSISGPQPAQAAVGTPNLPTSAQNQPAPSSGNPPTSTAAAVKHAVKRIAPTRPKSSGVIQVAGAHDPTPVGKLTALGAPKFNVIVPPGQREAVLRLVAAMQSGRVDVAGLLNGSGPQQLAPLEIAPLKIVPLDEKKTTGQTDGKNK